MKKLVSTIVICILVFSGVEAVAIATHQTNDLEIKTESIAISEPVFQDGGQYIKVSLKEAASYLVGRFNKAW